MSEADRRRWDARYADLGMASPADVAPPRAFSHLEDRFPREGRALELACGRGGGVVWLARRGLEVWGVDVSPVAIELARRLAEQHGVADRCHLAAHDLDAGLPEGPAMDLILCHLLRDARLDEPIMQRLLPGGLLAVATLSEVGAGPGRFRTRRRELAASFSPLEVLSAGEADGMAWLMARRRD